MPPKKRRSSATAAAEDYESDNGFVEDAPKSKKTKTTKNVKADSGALAGAGTKSVTDDGEIFWELSGKRRICLQEYKGNRMVNIREYYEKDGQMLPGKKGIALPIEQFNTFISILPQLEKTLTEKGEKVGRPDYSGAEVAAAVAKEEEEPETKAKKNFEETSDEE